MKAFKAPHDSIGPTDADTTATLIATAADVAIIVDKEGVIQDLAFQRADLSMELEGSGKWYGRHWSDVVAPDSQGKVEALIKEAGTQAASRWRQLTHQTVQGHDVPILYAAVRLGAGDRIVALGRDLRAVTTLQQRLVDAQMSMERDYAKLRLAESRYRLLFQTASEPVLILDAATLKIVEANPAATGLLERTAKRGHAPRSFGELFEAGSLDNVRAALSDLKGLGKTEEVEARLVDDQAVLVSASLFRQEGTACVLVRLAAAVATPFRRDGEATFGEFVRAAPDGFVLADAGGRILAANPAFATMVQADDEESTRGSALDQWFGREGVDFDVMMANLRQHGSVRLFSTTLNVEGGTSAQVEVSAVALGGKRGTFGFVVRDVGRRLGAPVPRGGAPKLPRSATQLSELIGRVPLKDLVRETTDVIEKLCIEKALELTGDNRASAAEMLGLSRQSLYVKLRRFGFAEAVAEDEGQA